VDVFCPSDFSICNYLLFYVYICELFLVFATACGILSGIKLQFNLKVETRNRYYVAEFRILRNHLSGIKNLKKMAEWEIVKKKKKKI